MRPSLRLRLAALIVGLALVAAACGGASGAGADGTADTGTITAENAAEAPSLPTTADALPAAGKPEYDVLLEELRGTPVVVNIWASWCGPCRAEAPHLAEAHGRVGDRVQFLGVDILDARESAKEFMQEFGWTYPSLFDADGEIRDRLGFIGQPVTIFYDADGAIVSSWNGPITAEELNARIDALLSG